MASTAPRPRVAELAWLPYDGAAINEQIGRIIRTVASSGLDGSHAACVELDEARRRISRALLRLDRQVTRLVKEHEASNGR